MPPRKLSLEQSLEFCREDECVEVTPDAVRIRKVVLAQIERVEAGAQEQELKACQSTNWKRSPEQREPNDIGVIHHSSAGRGGSAGRSSGSLPTRRTSR